jgi:prepilin-type N-terminal cleavage/methylation domain-containing protein/prepilin-type processing-associated H-X9-DG protein
MKLSKKNAFTLIELLVVIAIIAILAAILFPVFAQAKAAAKASVDLSNLKQLAMAAEMFKEDHNGNYPKGWFNDEVGGEQTSQPDPFWGWDIMLMPYVKNKGLYQSPLDSESFPRGLWNHATDHFHTNPGWIDGGEIGTRVTDDDIPASYRLNISNGPNGPWSSINESALDRPAEAILISASRPGATNDNWHHLATWEGAGNPGHVCIDFVRNIQYDRNSKLPENAPKGQRNGGRSNYAFSDGHAKSFAWSATWKKIGDDVDKAGHMVSPNYWRQIFSGWDDQCNYQEGQDR